MLEPLVQIGAPTGAEHRRAAFVRDWLIDAGLNDVWQDEVGNVLLRVGPADGKAILLDAHLDTVFPDRTLSVDQDAEGIWYCPGVTDNTASCALLMTLARKLVHQPPEKPLLISFTVGEEGRGDLRGIRHVIDTQGQTLEAAVILDLQVGTYSRQCVGSVRWQMRFETEGGHSWKDFGHPSAVHGAAQWVSALADLMAWRHGELTYNVGSFEGGQSVNAIASQADLLLDLRAVDPNRLAQAERAVLRSLNEHNQDQAQATATEIGRRPAAVLEKNHPLERAIRQAIQASHLQAEERIQSTNANYPAHRAIPSICLGLVRGGGIHTRSEYLDTNSLTPGLALLETALDQVQNSSYPT